MEVTVGSIRNVGACHRAAALLKQGMPVGTYIRGVCGLWADGHSRQGLDAIYRIKGEARGARPMGTTLASASFADMLDPGRIAPAAQSLMLDPNGLSDRLGSLCFIRAPIHREAGESLPERLVSVGEDGGHWLQNWLPEGCQTTKVWIEALQKQNVDLPVATSMNVSGEPELVDPAEGVRFCREHGVPMFLDDHDSPRRAKGSFPIVLVNRDGIAVIREGHFPARLFRRLLSALEVDLSGCAPAKYPLVDLPQGINNKSLSLRQLRNRLLEFLDGA